MFNHIFLVDDDEDEHLFFQWSLESLNLQVSLHSAYSSDQAERMVQHFVPDIIFLDINLSAKNGFHCLQIFRSIPSLADVPIYMYSTEINDSTVKKALRMGATGCVKKSRDNDQLCKSLKQVLRPEPLLPDNAE